MMLNNNTFKRMVYYFKEIDYLKHTTREKFQNNNKQKRDFDFDKKLLHENIK